MKWKDLVVVVLVFSLPSALTAEIARVPVGTTIYCELDQRVTSKKKLTSVGDLIRARVWQDVQANGRIVIRAGTPMFVRVSQLQGARVAGRKGSLELEAFSVPAVDGSEILLQGG